DTLRHDLVNLAFLRLRPYVLFLLTTSSPTAIYTLSLHDALPIYVALGKKLFKRQEGEITLTLYDALNSNTAFSRNISDQYIEDRSEEHTSELQSRENLVCRLLLEKKNYHDRFLRSTCRYHC